MTCDELKKKDIGCTLINYDGSLYLTDRIDKVNALGCDIVAEIHLNAGGGTGTEVYYQYSSAVGKELAERVSQSISSALNVPNRGAKTLINGSGGDHFAILRKTKAPALLIETVFIDSDDLEIIKTTEGMRKAAKAIASAIDKYINAPKPFKVRIITDELNIRRGPGTNYKVVGTVKKGDIFTITQVDDTGRWGKLKSDAGWINLSDKYVQRVK